MNESMNNTFTPPAEGEKWTQEHERGWYEKVVANSTLDHTEIETDLPFTSPEIQARIASTVQVTFGDYAKDIRITNRFYLALGNLIEEYTEWKNATNETRADALENLESEGISMRQTIISNNLSVIRAIEIANPTEEETGDVMRKYLDTFLKELVQKVVEPVFQKTLK